MKGEDFSADRMADVHLAYLFPEKADTARPPRGVLVGFAGSRSEEDR